VRSRASSRIAERICNSRLEHDPAGIIDRWEEQLLEGSRSSPFSVRAFLVEKLVSSDADGSAIRGEHGRHSNDLSPSGK
jgi:hypothetical protein